MELCNDCQKVGYCKALYAINQNGILKTKIVEKYQAMTNLFTTTPTQKKEYGEKIKTTEADHEAFVEISRIDAELKGCTKLEDFP